MASTDPPLSTVSADARAMMEYQARRKSAAIAYVFWFLLGLLGAHRFYVGEWISGLVMFALGLFGLLMATGVGPPGLVISWIWLVVDLFLIPGMIRRSNEALVHKLAS